jgi:pimeloyl-ACP methyl ester carboxylesterase
VLVHGFGSSARQNWKDTGWFDSLIAAGCALVAMDCRGHGRSDKPHDENAYGHDRMAEDVLRVMDAAGLDAADLVGYSMGGFIGLRLAAKVPERVGKLVLAGVGAHYLDGPRISSEGSRAMLSAALLAADTDAITDPRGRLFRAFADQPGKDRIALAACMRAMSEPLSRSVLSQLQQQVLVVCGEKDDIAGAPESLAQCFVHGEFASIPARDHMSAVGDPRTRRAVAGFLAG